MTVDCMTCLVRLEQPGNFIRSTNVDLSGITHATVRWINDAVLLCTLHFDNSHGYPRWSWANKTVSV